MVDDVAQSISMFMADYKAQYGSLPAEDRPKVLFVIDSLGALLTATDVDQFNKGELKGDMGRKPKALNALIKNCVIQFSDWEIGLVSTNHSYESQDMFNPDPKISGGSGFIYASSIVVASKKLALKEDEAGEKTSTVQGIRSAIKVVKTRFTKPFETMHIRIPYSSGIDPYSGLIDYCEDKGIFTKEGNRLKWVSADGVEHKKFRKEWASAEGRKILMEVMQEYEAQQELNKAEIIKQAAAHAIAIEETADEHDNEIYTDENVDE
jgi:hypothetical protein